MRAISTKRIKPMDRGVSSLSIEVEVASGTIIGRAVLEGIALARHLRCPVRFTFNGQRVHCRPDSIPEQVVQEWQNDMEATYDAPQRLGKLHQGAQP
jgi:hypothetical protein